MKNKSRVRSTCTSYGRLHDTNAILMLLLMLLLMLMLHLRNDHPSHPAHYIHVYIVYAYMYSCRLTSNQT